MAKAIKAKDLAKLSRTLGQFTRTDLRVEHEKGEQLRTLSEVRPDATAKGYPSSRRIRVVEDGREKYYDGNYEFQVVAVLVGGKRFPVGE